MYNLPDKGYDSHWSVLTLSTIELLSVTSGYKTIFLQAYIDFLPKALEDKVQITAYAVFKSAMNAYNAGHVLHCLNNEMVMIKSFWTIMDKIVLHH